MNNKKNRRAAEPAAASILEHLSEGIITSDGGAIVAANPAAARILGLSCERLLGRALFDPQWELLREDGSPWSGQAQAEQIIGRIRSDGTRVWMRLRAVPVETDGASIAVWSLLDVTHEVAQRRAAEEARSAPAHYDLLTRLPNRALLGDRLRQAM